MGSLDYVNRTYGKSFKRGCRVMALGKPGVVTRGTHYVYVLLDGEKHAAPYHPSDVETAAPTCPACGGDVEDHNVGGDWLCLDERGGGR